LLNIAPAGEADVLHPFFARVLHAHMDASHHDVAANVRIRDALDETELLLALKIEQAELRKSLPQPQMLSSQGTAQMRPTVSSPRSFGHR
jgi:transcription initiation factor IIE alpha subunit